jgi:hypothetical protein
VANGAAAPPKTGQVGAPPACRRPRSPRALDSGHLAGLARALLALALAEEVHAERLAMGAPPRSDRTVPHETVPRHPVATKQKGGRSCAA